jgi:hypothetical protein
VSQLYMMRKGHGAPRSGPGGTLAGVAEKGDRLDTPGYGSYINNGTKDAPQWDRLNTEWPTSGPGAIVPLDEREGIMGAMGMGDWWKRRD